jgi:4-amino-4-deoxy-L-arabinose transferase-like glycosyltransferase
VSRIEKFWVVVILMVFSLTLFTALVYPPNNNDSLTYHMGRIGHWMQQQSVRPFATHIERQLYQPPLSEWIILHTMLLSGDDWFANAVQWVAALGCCLELSLLSRMLGGNRKVQLATAFASATIPMVVLQASSTQNDLVVSYYVIALAICLLRYYQGRQTTDLLWAGLALGFALLTKGTAYLFTAPLIAAWSIAELIRLSRGRWAVNIVSLAGAGLVVVGIALMINAGHYVRNLSVYGHPLTDPKEQLVYVNEVHSFSMMLSTVSRNVALHFGFPGLHWVVQHGVEQLHDWLGMSVVDKRITYTGTQFDLPMLSNNEDNASNLLHLLWFSASVVWLLRIRKQSEAKPYLVLSIMVASMFLLFCAYLKWQPWHSRLHSTLSLLACPVCAYGLVCLTGQPARWLTGLISVSALCLALTNPFRPIITVPPITQPISFLDGRLTNYYVNGRDLRPFYQTVARFINQQKRDSLRVGMLIGENDWDYIWYKELNPTVRLHHVGVKTASRLVDEPLPVDYVISSRTFGDTLMYGERIYERVALTPERTPFLMPVVFKSEPLASKSVAGVSSAN